MCCLKLSAVGGRASFSASMALVCLHVLGYRSQMKDSVLSASFSSKFGGCPNRLRVVWWAALPCRIVHGFFFPWRDKLLDESQPMRAWNAGRDCHNLSPSFYCLECSGMYLWRSLTRVRNHRLLYFIPVKWNTHRASTSVSVDWITIADVGESLTAYAACRIILVSASSWLDLRASMFSIGLACVMSTTRSLLVKSPRLWGTSLALAFLVQSCKVMKTKSHTSWSYFVGFGCTWPTAWAPVY